MHVHAIRLAVLRPTTYVTPPPPYFYSYVTFIGVDATICTKQEPVQSTKRILTLQRWCSKWDCYVDATIDDLVDGDHVTVRDRVNTKSSTTHTEVRINCLNIPLCFP